MAVITDEFREHERPAFAAEGMVHRIVLEKMTNEHYVILIENIKGGPQATATLDLEERRALARALDPYLYTPEEVIQMANETSDNQGNLYRLDFIARIEHEAKMT